jgi:flavodoxin
MRVLVGYMSQTGNTKKVAEAIFGEIEGEKEIKKLNQIKDMEGYDLVFLGFPIRGFGPDKKAKKFLKTQCPGKKIALFITHAAPEDHEDLPGWLAKFKDAAIGATIVDMFNCQGQLYKPVKFVMSIHPDSRSWAKTDSSKGQPDAARLEKARVFARKVMNLI